MFLYLIRHAHARDAATDFERPLSDEGHAQVERLVEFLRGGTVPPPEEVWHSHLLRAAETAELVAHGLGWKAPVSAIDGLEPDADLRTVLLRVNASDRPLAIFGHEPFLGGLGALLVKGSTWPPAFAMHKCGMLALERMGERGAPWIVNWHLSPELFGLAG